MILETERLILREMVQADYPALCRMLQDEEVMYAYEHAFEDEEAHDWLDRQIESYHKNGFGLWAAVLKKTGKMIGQCGLTMQDAKDKQVLEVGYLFQKEFWHKGYAAESAIACKAYAFEKLGVDEVYSIIRDNNTASQNVAKRNGMKVQGEIVKHYHGMEMPHQLYSITRKEWKDQRGKAGGPEMSDLNKYICFIKEAELLKNVLRTSWLTYGEQESTAEHSWRLALLAGVMLEEFPELDANRVLMMCLLHDLGEMYDGDISAATLPDSEKKYEEEHRAVQNAFSLLPEKLSKKYMAIWQEYEDAKTAEALYVKALDKAETIIQHNQGKTPSDFDYGFNLQYGKEYFERNELFRELRTMLDKDTRERMGQVYE